MENPDLERGLWGGAIALLFAFGAWMRHLIRASMEREIDERIAKAVEPLDKKVDRIGRDCRDTMLSLQTMSSTFTRLEGALGENIGKLAEAIEKLSDKVSDQGEQISKFEGRWEGKERRAGNERRRRPSGA